MLAPTLLTDSGTRADDSTTYVLAKNSNEANKFHVYTQKQPAGSR